MLRIFSSIDVEGKRSLPPVIDWMENSDILGGEREVHIVNQSAVMRFGTETFRSAAAEI